MPAHPWVSYQPLRLVFNLSYLAITLPFIPYYVIKALVPAFRPDRTWTAKQTLMTHLSYSMLDAVSRVGITEDLSLEPGKEGARFQTISPSPDAKAYKGPLASKTVRPARIGGTWSPAPPGADLPSKTVALYLHGGAFIQGNGRDADYGQSVSRLLKQGVCDAVFSLQYRLSGHGGLNPYPAALQDALTGYLFLLGEKGVPAANIVLVGDSAGGNLATALLRYLGEYPGVAPPPKAAVLFSSWVEPFYLDVADNPHRGTDFIPATYPGWGARCYGGSARDNPHPQSDPYVSPLGHPFATPVPIWASAGAAEMFFERILQWAGEMRGVPGNRVEACEEEGAVHDSFFVGELLGFEESANEVTAKAGRWVRSL